MIYVITEGEYSDYHICAVATTPKRAEELRRMYSNHCYQAEIEEFKENIPNDSFYHPNPIYYWEFSFDRKGNKKYSRQYWDENNLSLSCHGFGTDTIIIRDIVANDEEHAFKIACDARAKYLAEQYSL